MAGSTRYYRIATGGAIAVALALAPSLVSAAPKYRIIDLGSLIEDGEANALSINNLGQVVGEADSACGGRRAFLWQNGEMIDISDSPCDVQSSALDINNRGQIVFFVPPLSYLWDRGQITPLGHLGHPYTEAWALNDVGQVTGLSYVAPFEGRAFLLEKGKMIDLGVSDTEYTIAWDINNQGQIVGNSGEPSLHGGFLWDNGTITDLGALGGPASAAFGINNYTEIVGLVSLRFEELRYSAFLWQNGVMVDLGTPAGFRYSQAAAINNSGQIVGEEDGSGDVDYPFLYDNECGLRSFYDLLPSDTPWRFLQPNAVNDFGQIVGYGLVDGLLRGFLMTPIFGDFNGNGATDINDCADFYACFTGPGGAEVPGCVAADLDRDGDVDLIDFRVFQLWFETP